MEILLKIIAVFSCRCRTTKGSSCNDLEKKELLRKIEMNSRKLLLKTTLGLRSVRQ